MKTIILAFSVSLLLMMPVTGQQNSNLSPLLENPENRTSIYLNGKKIGEHVGGFTPFNFEITGKLKNGNNFITLQVDNVRKKDGVPTLKTDWWNYGGIIHSNFLCWKESRT